MTFNQGNTKASKLDGEQVMQIREKYATNLYTYARLSLEYCVSENTVRSIVKGTSWQRLPTVKAASTISEEALRSMKKLEALLNTDNLPPATIVDDETLAAMEKAVASMPQPEFDKPSADMAARMAAYGIRTSAGQRPAHDEHVEGTWSPAEALAHGQPDSKQATDSCGGCGAEYLVADGHECTAVE